MSNYLLVEGESYLALYLTKQRKIFKVPRHLREEIESLCAYNSEERQSGSTAVKPVLEALEENERPLARPARQGFLRRVSLNVTNACNMACSYCYANEGEYGSPRGLMTEDVARLSIETFFTHYDTIEAVQFFGGEPLMNPQAILAACQTLEDLVGRGAVAEMPLLGLVTNGTVLNKRVEQLIRTYKPSVTVSFDGPPPVNDAVRVMKNERGVGARIIENAHRMAELIGHPVGIEATWSAAQERAGMTVHDLVQYLRRTFETPAVHVAPVSLPEGHPYRPHGLTCFADSVPKFAEDLKAGDGASFSKFRSSMRAFAQGLGSDVFCDAGLGVLAVSGNGDVYPCFMFIDQDDFKMGNVQDSDLFTSARFQAVTARFAAAGKKHSEQCGECPLRPVCSGCLGANLFETGSPFRVAEETCRMNFKFNEAILLAVAGMGGHV
jgi:hypothetical protein